MLKMVNIQDLIRRSSGATCAAFERQVIVPTGNAAEAIRMIKASGSHMFIGSGPAGKGRTKVWFIRRGLTL